MFGLGGITVEVLGDHVTRLAPLTDADAREMVTGLRGSALLAGYRGQPAVDVDSLVQVLHRVSRLVEELPEVAELDCNPVIATPAGALVGGRPYTDRPECRAPSGRHPPPALARHRDSSRPFVRENRSPAHLFAHESRPRTGRFSG